MDLRACFFVVIVLIQALCLSFTSATSEDNFRELEYLSKAVPSHNILSKRLAEEHQRAWDDLTADEDALMSQVSRLQERKRQLEIKKRTPIRCLVNVVSCWKRK